MNLKCFLWDLDGVLTDTTRMHRDAWLEAIRTEEEFENALLGEEIFDKYFLGVPRIVGIRRFIIDAYENKGLTPDEVEEKTQRISSKKNELFRKSIKPGSHIEIYRDSLDLIKWAKGKGIRNGLASQSENAELVVRQTMLDSFLDSLATGKTARDNNIRPKPDKEFYLHAAEKAKCNVSNCIAFEDTYVGAASAITAGVGMCIGVARKNSSYMELAAAGCNIIVRELMTVKDIIDLGQGI